MGPGLFRLFLSTLVVLDHLKIGVYFGRYAVFTFFILSGYWIRIMWEHKYSRFIAPLSVFYISRAWRIYPAFWIALLVTVGLRFGIAGLSNIPISVTSLIAQGYAYAFYLDPAWSLADEIKFYLVTPFLFALSFGASRCKLLTAIGLLSVPAFLAVPLLSALTYFPQFGTVMVFFMIGWVAAQIGWHPKRKVVFVSVASSVLFVCLSRSISAEDGAFFVFAHPYFHYESIVLTFLGAPAAIATVYNRAGRADGFWGDYSYSLYLAHWPIVTNAGGVTLQVVVLLNRSAEVRPFIIMGLAILAGLALYILERPASAARNQWLRRRPRLDEASTGPGKATQLPVVNSAKRPGSG